MCRSLLASVALVGSVHAQTAAPAASQPHGQTLTVVLEGVAHERGSVRVGLYATPSSFRKEMHALAVHEAPAAPGVVRVVFDAVPAGRYAVMAYHDEDGDGKLNMRFGMFPAEGYGLSNNPRVMGPPAFEDSAFEVAADRPSQINVVMKY
ncbi:DUF2141 domain-containing protein [Azoarcus indigens]|uniref:Uncharacterized protein (DUF2141 family) n=1 Tax=Azoarcus indigens TaxID=29545 RepID=A0A4R6DTD5_9RHOO|nr:DUF2141 domain-containing protein [Azoarcus indigens]TDN48401.1 uncharacterized protein (DUF2141 family) [Azoarcus indigens]